MDSIIKQILEADKIAHEKVKEALEIKDNIGETLKIEKVSLIEKYEKETKNEVQQEIDKIEKELVVLQKESDNEFKKNVDSLHKSYEENKDTWVEYMLKACIES